MKIFLSSTYLDLVQHRLLATEALERLGQQVDRMEVFGAQPVKPPQACLAEIEMCDLFVGIYAHRYGHIPPGSNISITEAEFQHAKKHNKPLFCFLVDEDHPWPPKMVEEEPGKSKLLAFKQKIGEGLVQDTFTTPQDLAFKVASAIGRYLSQDSSKRAGEAQLRCELEEGAKEALFWKEIFVGALIELGVVKASSFMLEELTSDPGALPQIMDAEAQTFDELDLGETPRFLARQRVRHRIRLAREKWVWLVLATYYHPVGGRRTTIPSEWHPRRICGQFTTCDFASMDLPFQTEIGRSAPSEIRVLLLHKCIDRIHNLWGTISALEDALRLRIPDFGFQQKSPWQLDQVAIPWASLYFEITGRSYPNIDHFNSFCGFKSLFYVQDTPESGIRVQTPGTSNMFAYAAAIELAWVLRTHDPSIQKVYDKRFKQATKNRHQYALRYAAMEVLSEVWKGLRDELSDTKRRSAD